MRHQNDTEKTARLREMLHNHVDAIRPEALQEEFEKMQENFVWTEIRRALALLENEALKKPL